MPTPHNVQYKRRQRGISQRNLLKSNFPALAPTDLETMREESSSRAGRQGGGTNVLDEERDGAAAVQEEDEDEPYPYYISFCASSSPAPPPPLHQDQVQEEPTMTTRKKRLEAVVFGSVWLLLSLNLLCLVLSILYGAKALGLESSAGGGDSGCPLCASSFLVWNAIWTSLFQAMVFHYICSMSQQQQQHQQHINDNNIDHDYHNEGDVLDGDVVRERPISTPKNSAVVTDPRKQNILTKQTEDGNDNDDDRDNTNKIFIARTRLCISTVWLCWLGTGIYCLGRLQQQQQQQAAEDEEEVDDRLNNPLCQNVTNWIVNGVSASLAALAYNAAMGLCCYCLERQYKKREERRAMKRHDDGGGFK
jgi:hypothetical protein